MPTQSRHLRQAFPRNGGRDGDASGGPWRRRTLIGELDMYREAGIKPNFSDIARPGTPWRRTEGRATRGDRAGSFDAHIRGVRQPRSCRESRRHPRVARGIPARPTSSSGTASPSGPRRPGAALRDAARTEPSTGQLQDGEPRARSSSRMFAATLGHSRRHIHPVEDQTTDDRSYATIARLGGVPREWEACPPW